MFFMSNNIFLMSSYLKNMSFFTIFFFNDNRDYRDNFCDYVFVAMRSVLPCKYRTKSKKLLQNKN